MSNEQTTNQTETPQHATTSAEHWQEVGKQFQTLGESLAAAFRTAWNDEQNRKRLQEMQKGVESMLTDVGKALDDTAKSPQMKQAKVEAEKAAESLRLASEKTYHEVRPQLVSAIRQLNEELQKLIVRMEQGKPAAESKSTEVSAPDATPEPMDSEAAPKA